MKPPRQKKSFDNYVKYTNIAFQMAAVIVIGVFAGVKIDQYIPWRVPVFTLLFSALSVGAAIYLAIRDFLKKP